MPFILYYTVLSVFIVQNVMQVQNILKLWTHRLFGLLPLHIQQYNTLHFRGRIQPWIVNILFFKYIWWNKNLKSLLVQMSNTIVKTLKNHILKVTITRYQWYSAFELRVLQRELRLFPLHRKLWILLCELQSTVAVKCNFVALDYSPIYNRTGK
jgi:hypothetical protein